LACGCGSGVFVGTDRRYPENWLQGLVGERTGNSSLDVFKAGLSVFLGFLVAQIVLSLFLRQGYSWTDEDETREDVCNVSDNNGHVDPLLGIE